MSIRHVALIAILAMCIGAILVTERRDEDVSAGPEAVTGLIAGSERELSRVPMRVTRMTDAEEIRIGDNLARFAIDKDVQRGVVEDYLTAVGARVARGAQRKLPYRFHYLPDANLINAFALPGGHVFVAAGLLEMMDSEDELASVLGHEIAHVDLYHCAERVQVERSVRLIPLGELVALPVQLFQAGYTKDQELEADRDGLEMAVKAGYSPAGALRFHEKFARLYEKYAPQRNRSSRVDRRARTGPINEIAQGSGDLLRDYFRTHPEPAERIAQVRRQIESNHWNATQPEKDLRIAYIYWSAKAKRALNARQYDVAANLATRSLAAQPKQAETLRILGYSRQMLAQFKEASAAYRQLLDINPLDAGVIHEYADTLGAAAITSGNHSEAATEFRRWLAENPESMPVARVEAVGLSAVAGDLAPSEPALIQARGGSSDWNAAWDLRLAQWHYRARRLDTAEMLLRVLFPKSVNRGHEVGSDTLGWTLLEVGNLRGALEAFQATSDGRAGRAVILWRQFELTTALSELDAAAHLDPTWRNPSYVAGFYSPGVVASISEMLRAEENIRHKTPKAPDLPEVHAMVEQATHVFNAGQLDDALKLTESALRLDPRSAEAWYTRGVIEVKLQRYAPARADLERSIALDPRNYNAYAWIDPLLVAAREFTRLESLWSGYIQVSPSDGRGWLARAKAHALAGALDQEVSDAAQACKLGVAEGCALRDQLRSR